MLMRFFVAAMLAAPAAAAPPVKAARPTAAVDWNRAVVATPDGGYRIGNPAAKVKLVEYASLTCPHCRTFQLEGLPQLRARYIASGRVSYEFRNFVLNGPDYAASVLARCAPPAQVLGHVDHLFATQAAWTQPFASIDPATAARLEALDPDAQIGGLARAGKLDAVMRARGLTQARIDACLADKAGLKRLAEMRETAVRTYKVAGTPTFLINGQPLAGEARPVITWAQLEPRLVEALR